MKTVALGNSGLKVTELGFGGIPIMRVTMDEAKEIIRHCFELGIRFFDTAHVYADSEEKLGAALEPYRKQVVIATKVFAKDAEGAAKELAMSLDRLRTDRLDLIQCHNVSNQADLDRVLGPGGAYEVLVEAKAEGKTRAVGFSSHNPDIAVKTMGLAKFDTLQFPFNFIEHAPLDKVFPAARERGMGIIAMKPLGGGLLDRADLCFRFLQQYPEAVPIPGIQSKEEIQEIVGYYEDRKPLSEEDRQEIQAIRNELGGRFCRRCEYCMPCEQGVQIPKILLVKPQAKRFRLNQLLALSKAAVATGENCVECGECVEKCPYHLPIPEMLRENVEIFQKLQDEYGKG
jgi:predicted aldo/keto reductase-like oxidoreductase